MKHLPIDTKYFKDLENDILALNLELNGLLIEGDNWQVLNALKEEFRGKIKSIYIDPPYNTGNNDFTYYDNYKRLSWLIMMKNRLELAREFLSDDGVIFVSIDDNEQAYLKVLMDDVFGGENFIGDLIWKSKSGGGNNSNILVTDHEYILAQSKFIKNTSFNFNNLIKASTSYPYDDSDGLGKYGLERLDKQNLGYQPSLDYPIKDLSGVEYYPEHKKDGVKNAIWRWSRQVVKDRFNELVFKDGHVYTKNYEKDGMKARSLLTDEIYGRSRTGSTEHKDLFKKENLFKNPKPESLINFLFFLSTNQNDLTLDDLTLDFFLGSGTSSAVAHKMGRKYIGIEANQKTFHEVAIPRMKKVLNGEQGGISKKENWKGGGIFKYSSIC